MGRLDSRALVLVGVLLGAALQWALFSRLPSQTLKQARMPRPLVLLPRTHSTQPRQTTINLYVDVGANNGDSISSFLGHANPKGFGNMEPDGAGGGWTVWAFE